MIIRSKRPSHFTVINNEVFSDLEPLSWDAMGMLCCLLSKPDNWTVSPSALANTRRCGINKIHSLLKELRESRFVVGKKYANGDYNYYVHDSRQPEDLEIMPHHEKPDQEMPHHEKADQDPSRQVNTEYKQELNKTYAQNAKKRVIALVPGFIEFYKIYPKKKGRQLALKAWDKLNPDEELQRTINAHVLLSMEKDQQWQDSQSIPYPASYLNGGRWEDEITIAKQITKQHKGFDNNLPIRRRETIR